MFDTTAVERFFCATPESRPQAVEDLLTAGTAGINTVADLLANQKDPLEPGQLQEIAQLLKELSMLTFGAWEKGRAPPAPPTTRH